jgi:hypothetical protein
MPIDPRYIRIPLPEPPGPELLQAVDLFYQPDQGPLCGRRTNMSGDGWLVSLRNRNGLGGDVPRIIFIKGSSVLGISGIGRSFARGWAQTVRLGLPCGRQFLFVSRHCLDAAAFGNATGYPVQAGTRRAGSQVLWTGSTGKRSGR